MVMIMSRPARSRRRRPGHRPASGISPGVPPADAMVASAAPGMPAGASPAAPPRGPAKADESTSEKVWERTHLEQTMFSLAREHAEAASRSARAAPPDRDAEQTHSLLAVLMSFLALEAFINMVGGDRLGSRYRHYDRMSPEGKWMEVTRLVSKSGRTFAEDGPELKALSTLRTWRNMLTHYKGEYEDVQQAGRGGETKIEALLSADNAARAVEIARGLYRAFYELDRRSAPRQFVWLDDRPHRPAPPEKTLPPSPQTASPQTAPPAAPREHEILPAERAAPSIPTPAPGRRRRRRR